MKYFFQSLKNIAGILLLTLGSHIYAQNIISVPFNDGFVGDVVNNTSASNAVKFSTNLWSNVQFIQNSTSTIFVAQGNDIPGSVFITDSQGVSHEIIGFITHFKKLYPDLSVILCGGDAKYFDNINELNIFVLPNLVLQGLNAILRFNGED